MALVVAFPKQVTRLLDKPKTYDLDSVTIENPAQEYADDEDLQLALQGLDEKK